MSGSVRIGIVGTGISGLTTAFYLIKLGQQKGLVPEITLLDKSGRTGGVIRTERVGDLLLEAGPEGWASYKPSAKRLVHDLELQDQIIGSNDQFRKNYVVRNGALTSLPDGMMFLTPVEPLAFWRTAPLSWRGKFRASLEPFVPRSQGDLSAREFFERRLGREFTQVLVEPLISAVLGTDYNLLSTPMALPEMYRAEQRKGSLWRGLRKFAKITSKTSVLFTLREGMATLTQSLEERIPGAEIVLNAEDLRIKEHSGKFSLAAKNFEGDFDYVILCTPATSSQLILEECCPEVAQNLADFPYSSSSLVYLAYKRSEFSHPLNGFGFIVPSNEAAVLDACTWVTTKFNGRCPSDTVLLRCAIHGGRKDREGFSDEELAERVHGEIARIMGISCPPTFRRVYRIRQALPQLLVGHRAKLQRLGSALESVPRLKLAASFWGGVGVPDCIRTGQETAQQIIDELAK